jgi:hypothetical protein
MPYDVHIGAELASAGRKILTSHPEQSTVVIDSFKNDPNSKWYIVDSIHELSLQEARKIKGKVVLIGKGEQLNIFDVKDVNLQARQSRSHRFDLPDREDARILDITVSIMYQGSFNTKGYRLGRIAAGLYRLPDEKDKDASPMPTPVGYAPYAMQSPNLPDSMGKIIILHRPQARPIKPHSYQIVIGAASTTHYSINVTCRIAQTALPIIDAAIDQAKQWQQRTPQILIELEVLSESLRLAERKLLVVDKMITEAELESKKAQRRILDLNTRVQEDDEQLTLLDEERRQLIEELSLTESEFAQWSTTYASRCKEKEDVLEGIALMHKFQRERQREKVKNKEDLTIARRDLPACIALLRSLYEASNVAASLNTTIAGASASAGSGKDAVPVISTPAEDIRRIFRREGFNTLSLEEQQWCIMDQALNPHKYEWLREAEEEENQKRLLLGKKPKVKKLSAAVEAFKISKIEIEHILSQPFSMLNRKEMIIRKLMKKFHDNSELIKRGYAAAAYGFDPHIAERTRAKNYSSFTKEEREWASIDKILHPQVWKFYSNHDSSLSFLDKDAKLAKGNLKTHKEIATAGSTDKRRHGRADQAGLMNNLGKILGIQQNELDEQAALITGDCKKIHKFAIFLRFFPLLVCRRGTQSCPFVSLSFHL